MKLYKWYLQYFKVTYNPKTKQFAILKHYFHFCFSKEQALSIAHNDYEHSLVKKVAPRQFAASDFFRYDHKFSFSIVQEIYEYKKQTNLYCGFDLDNKSSKQRMLKTILFFYENVFNYDKNGFVDMSLTLSRWHRITTMPKNCRLLKAGEIIRETDSEYISSSNSGFWGMPSWYNIGKRVKEGNGITFIHRDGKKTRYPKGTDPIICRKKK